MAAATPRSHIDWTWNVRTPTGGTSPPLELQLLPLAPFAATESSWGVDPSRLQQLMMGSATSSGSATPAAATISAPCSTARDLGSLFDDHTVSEPLPSGWERCLDLQSGEMFLKKCDAPTRDLQSLIHPHPEQGKDGKESGTGPNREPEASSQADELRQDWSRRWLHSEMTRTSEHEAAKCAKISLSVAARLGTDGDDTSSLPDGEPLCLDLKLTSEKRSRLSIEAQDPTFLRASNGIVHDRVCTGRFAQDLVELRKWQRCTNGSANIQEMARESTMVTAVCSKCLMYVLLRKSSPVCPRCYVPIILDGALVPSVNKKRPLLELSPDDLSLSTDSSR